MDESRVEMFTEEMLYIKSEEIIQRDLHFNTPFHYLIDRDDEVDILLDHMSKTEA